MKIQGSFLPRDVIVYCLVPHLDHVYDFMALRSTCKALQEILANVDESKLKYGSCYTIQRLLDAFIKTIRVSFASHRGESIFNYNDVRNAATRVLSNLFPGYSNLTINCFTTINHKRVWEMLSDFNYDWENVQGYRIMFLPRRRNSKEILYISTIVKDEEKECSVLLNSEKVISIVISKMKLKWRE